MTDEELLGESLMSLKEVLKVMPVSKSTWYAGIRSGRFPKPVKIGPGRVGWRRKDIFDLLKSLSA